MTNTLISGVEPKVSRFGRILKRILLYIGLAFAGLGAMALIVAVSIHYGVTNYFTGGWIGFYGYTGLLFWVLLSKGRSYWHHWGYWVLISAVLVMHGSVFIAILTRYPQFRMIWFWPITLIEAGIIGATIEWFFPEIPAKQHRTRKS